MSQCIIHPGPLIATIFVLSALPIIRTFIYNAIATCISFIRWNPTTWIAFTTVGVYFSSDIIRFIARLSVFDPWWRTFLVLFIFKFLKVFVHTLSYLTYRPTPIPDYPTYTSQDCTVIIPTVGDLDAEFEECVRSILACNPAELLISTVGDEKLTQATEVCSTIDPVRIRCVAIDRPNKRHQVVHAANEVQTPITVLADDHVFWPTNFLQSALAPFEDLQVGLVGTVKRVRREFTRYSRADFLNYIACIYLERHNFECTASHNIDGGVFVISGRTALVRTSVYQSTKFQEEFLNEKWLFGKIGPMNVDDDNFNTRFMVKNGFKIVFHNSKDALMETTLGTTGGYKKFKGQLDRWARTTWRSNSTSLFSDRTVWKSQPWSIYAVYMSSFVNFALFYDLALALTLYSSPYGTTRNMWYLGLLIFLSKLIKPLPHLLRNPYDWFYLPFGILFGYYHSTVKLNALLTCYNIAWGTRTGVDGAVDGSKGAGNTELEEDKGRITLVRNVSREMEQEIQKVVAAARRSARLATKLKAVYGT